MDSRLAILTDYVRQKNAAAAAASKLEPKQTWSSQTYFRLQVSSVAQFVSLFCGCWTFDTGCSLSDHPTSLPINPQYDDWLSSGLRRPTKIVQNRRPVLNFRRVCVNFCKCDENQQSYFGLIYNKICWSDKDRPVSSRFWKNIQNYLVVSVKWSFYSAKY